MDVALQIYFKDSFLDDVIYENYSSGGYETIKSTFNVSIYLKKPPSVLKNIFQRENYDVPNYVVTKNETKTDIPSEYLYKQPASN